MNRSRRNPDAYDEIRDDAMEQKPQAALISGSDTWTIGDCVEQLESCDYECEAGLLKNNVAYRRMLAIHDEQAAHIADLTSQLEAARAWQPVDPRTFADFAEPMFEPAAIEAQADRIRELEAQLAACRKIRTNYSMGVDPIEYDDLYHRAEGEIDSLRAQLARANAKDSEKTRDINLLTRENRQQAAQLATVRSELAMVEAGAGVIEAQRDELQRALKAKTDWVEKVGERAAKLASRIASNDYEVQAMESLANELTAATERERRINQRAEILFDGIQGAHDMVTRWLADPSAPATEKLIELAGLLETQMDVTGRRPEAALAASEKGREQCITKKS